MITGTNGKSTVTTLLGDILQQAGFHTWWAATWAARCATWPRKRAGRLAGGRGQLLPDRHHGALRPRVGVCSTSPRTTWTATPACGLRREQMVCFRNQAEDDVAVLCAEDPRCGRAEPGPGPGVGLRRGRPPAPGGWLRAASWCWTWGGPPAGQAAPGALGHRLQPAELPGRLFGRPGLRGRGPGHGGGPGRLPVLGHRLALVGEKDGVKFYDDSRAPTGGGDRRPEGPGDAGGAAAGRRDKDGHFADLAPLLRGKVARWSASGTAGPAIQAQLAELTPCELAPDLATAVRLAARLAAPGQAVLLSPGCASFDAYSATPAGRAFSSPGAGGDAWLRQC